MKWSEAKDKAKEKVWAFLELRPTGRVLTKEQYDYAMYYAKHTGIDCRYIRSFEEEKGKISASRELVWWCIILFLLWRSTRRNY